MDKSDYKVCTECGQEKHVSEFSKSYPHRCKACVAEHTRMVSERAKQEQNRAEKTENRAKMQKVVVKDGRRFPMFALEFSKEIDWEQRRYEIAKDMMAAIFSNPSAKIHIDFPDIPAGWAVEFADALITELVKNKDNEYL